MGNFNLKKKASEVVSGGACHSLLADFIDKCRKSCKAFVNIDLKPIMGWNEITVNERNTIRSGIVGYICNHADTTLFFAGKRKGTGSGFKGSCVYIFADLDTVKKSDKTLESALSELAGMDKIYSPKKAKSMFPDLPETNVVETKSGYRYNAPTKNKADGDGWYNRCNA